MRWTRVRIVILIILLNLPIVSYAQSAQPEPVETPSGVTGSVAREFVPLEPDDAGFILLSFGVIALDPSQLDITPGPDAGPVAEAIGSEFMTHVIALDPSVTGKEVSLRDVPIPTIAEWSSLAVSNVAGDGADIGILVVVDGPMAYVAAGARKGGNIGANLAALTRTWLADTPPPSGSDDSPYLSDGLWAELPTPVDLDQLGTFDVDREWVVADGPAIAEGRPRAESLRATGTRENPFPLGATVELSDGWSITVNDVQPNARKAIQAENQFNDPPAPGQRFFLINITATYNGDDSASFDGDYRLRAVGGTNVSYSTFENSCGVVPDEMTDTEVFSGGTISGNICWAIDAEDSRNLVMYDDPFSFGDRERVFLALTN